MKGDIPINMIYVLVASLMVFFVILAAYMVLSQQAPGVAGGVTPGIFETIFT